MKTKRILAAVLSLVMLVSLCACGTEGNTDTPVQPDVAEPLENGRYPSMTVAIAMDPENLEPRDGNGTPRVSFYWNIYETLFDYDENGSMVPSIGKSITCVDELTYDVEIYDCVYDSEGNHITAADVVYSVNWLIESGNAVKYDLYESIEAINEYTVRWHWNEAPASWGDLEFPLCRTYVFSQTAFENHNFSSEPVGTGSYVVKSYTSGSSLVLEANDDYWLLKNPEIMDTHLDLHRANVQTIEYKVIAEAAQAQIALQQGTVDYCDYVMAAVLHEFQTEKYADVYKTDSTVSVDYLYLSPNCYSGVMSDVNLRLAIWYALDSQSIATVMGGQYIPMDTFGNEAYPDYVAEWAEEATYMNTQDLEKAKDYLAKSSYNDETLILAGDSGEATKNALTMIQTQLGQIGIKSKIQVESQSMFMTTIAAPTGWDLHLAGIGGTSLVGSYNRLFGNGVNTYEGESYSIGWIHDDTLQSLYDTAKAEETADATKTLIDYVMEQGYSYALVGTSSTMVYSAKIEDLYQREGFYPTIGCSTFVGCEAGHSQNVTVLNVEMPEPSVAPTNVYTFSQVMNPDGDKFMYWALTLNGEDGWVIDVTGDFGEFHFTGDAYFSGNEEGTMIRLTPPNEGAPAGINFYNEDGTCDWELLPGQNLVPLNYDNYESYRAEILNNVNVFTFSQAMNPEGDKFMHWTLTLNGEDGWVLDVTGDFGEFHFTGDAYFAADEAGTMIRLTPPNEGAPAGISFYNEDGTCDWSLDKTTGTMVPLNLEG